MVRARQVRRFVRVSCADVGRRFGAAAVVGTLLAVALGTFQAARAEVTPEATAIVVNADSWASRWIANEYQRLRGIPDVNVVPLAGLSGFERMNVDEFRERILRPVLDTLHKRGVRRQIHAIVYSADFPTAINIRSDIGDRKLPVIFTPEAAINGLTYAYSLVLDKDIRYLDLNVNAYAQKLVQVVAADTPWTDDEQRRLGETLQVLNTLAEERRKRNAEKPAKPDAEAAKPETPKPAESKPDAPKPDAATPDAPRPEAPPVDPRRETALANLRALREAHPNAVPLLYNLACVEAQFGLIDDALKSLTAAINAGWRNARHMQNDPDLQSLRDRDAFKELVERIQNAPVSMTPPIGFRADRGWSAAGQPTESELDPHYLLSTMLACTSGRGLSVRESLGQLRRSVAADYSRPSGTVYFPKNGDVRSTTREWGFQSAAEHLQKLGIRAEVTTGVLPPAKAEVAGAVIGTAGFDWKSSGATIQPGAIVEHLTSFGGVMMADAGQTPLSEFLRHGAAGASGTVTEPYAIQAKFPTPFIQVAYARGLSLAEAFYQSVSGPYQLLIVGDALCRPWAENVALSIAGLPDDGVARGSLELHASARDKSGTKAIEYRAYCGGRLVASSSADAAIVIDTTKLSDGPQTLTIVGIGPGPVAFLARSERSIAVANHQSKWNVVAPNDGELSWLAAIKIEASCVGAREIAFRQQGRDVAKIDGESGRVSLDPRQLGPGPVTVTPVAIVGEREVLGRTLRWNIVPPPAFAALPADATAPEASASDLGPLRVRAGDGEWKAAAQSRGDWLAKAGAQANSPIVIEWDVTSETGDVFQLQWSGNVEVTALQVNGQPIEWPASGPWRYVPVSLAAGKHRVRMTGTCPANPMLEVRWGARGTNWLKGR